MADNCNFDPERECLGIQKAKEASGEVKELDRRLTDFQKSVAETHSRFGARIGKLEAREEVREEQYKNIREKLDDITKDVSAFQREQKDSIRELREETKESLAELKRGNQQIVDLVTPFKHKAEDFDKLSDKVEAIEDRISPLTHKIGDVDRLSGTIHQMQVKPAEKWEGMKDKFVMAFIGALGSFAFGAVLWLIIQVGSK